MDSKTYFVYDYNEMEDLIIEKLRNGVNGDHSKGEEFSLVALGEWNNDSEYAFDDIKKSDGDDSFFQEYGKKDVEKYILTGKWETFSPSVVDLLTYMVWKDMIPEGSYLIKVCW